MTLACPAPRINRWACCRDVVGVAIVAALVPLAGQAAWAQEPVVVIGGSGLPAIEINLDAIEDSFAPPRSRQVRRLLIPGEKRLPGAPIVLRPPRGVRLIPPSAAVAPVLTPPSPRPSPVPRPSPAPSPPPAVAKAPPPAPTPPPAVAKAPPPAPAPQPGATPAPPPPPPAVVPAPTTTKPPEPEPPRQVATAPVPPPPAKAPVPPPPPTAEPAKAPPPPASPPETKPAPRRQVATLEPGDLAEVEGHKGLRLLYEAGSAQLPAAGEVRLKALAELLTETDDRIQLKAYGGGDATSAARRLSLSRALAVRSYLIEQGVRSTRIDVRALGIAKDGGPADRVDVLLLNR